MPHYQIEEMFEHEVVASHFASAPTPLEAVELITGRPVSRRALQPHWFKVTDEGEGVTFEFSCNETHLGGRHVSHRRRKP